MPTKAFKGGLTVKRLNTTLSPNAYQAVQEVNDLSSFGETNTLIDATNFDSGNNREYIAGLADGDEITLQCNRVHSSPSVQELLIADVKAGSTIGLQVTITDGTTLITYTFNVVALGYTITPSFEDKALISYTLKISGSITES